MPVEPVTPLGPHGTENGPARNLNESPSVNPDGLWSPRCFFRAFASSDQSGTLKVQQSPDGNAWYTTSIADVVADATQGTVVESMWTLQYARAQFVNGAIAQTEFMLADQLAVE